MLSAKPMIYFDSTSFTHLAIHKVGNKTLDEGIQFSKADLKLDEDIRNLLQTYFLSPFKSNEYYNLFHESDLSLNEIFVYATNIFENNKKLHKESINIAKHLYEHSTHPKVKGGELYVVYFKDCLVEGVTCDAIGLFKSENKDTFLKVYPVTNEDYQIEQDYGININKLDKGCLIFNTEKENGYMVSVVDTASKTEAQYWMDHFLHIRQRNDEYYQTSNVMSLCKSFVMEQMPEEFEVSKTDKIDLLNRSVEYFKTHDSFEKQDFEQEVFHHPEMIQSFRSFDEQYRQSHDIEIEDSFDISASAVKKQARVFKSVLKLDKNFHIYIHGNKDLIEQGVDKDGRKYYKIYYNEEN